MFERYTDQARRVVAQAQIEASTQHRRRVGTEHILLALTEEHDGSAAAALSQDGADPKDIRQHVMLATHAKRRARDPCD